MIRGQVGFYFHLRLVNNVLSFQKMCCEFISTVVARLLNKVSLLHLLFLWLVVLFRTVILDLLHICVVFCVRFRHNRNVLLINLGVLCRGKGLCFDWRLLEKRVGEKSIFLEYTSWYDNPEYGL